MKKNELTVGVFAYDFFPFIGVQGKHIYHMYQQNQIHKKIHMVVFSPNKNNLPNHVQLFPETKSSRLKNIEYSWKLNSLFEELIDTYQLDVIHMHGGLGGLFILKKLSVPIIYTTYHTYWQQYKYVRRERWKYPFFLLEKQSYQHADQIIYRSNDIKKILTKNYHIDPAALYYIPDGVEQKKEMANISIDDNFKNILYIQTFDKNENVDILLNTMTYLKHIDPEITLHVIGSGKKKNSFREKSNKNNLPIIFYENISNEQLQEIYTNISIQIVHSTSEECCMSILEGMANQTPVIATGADDTRNIIKHNYSGMLVSSNDHQELADTIIYLFANPQKRRELVTNALHELPKYNWKKNYFKTIQLYETIYN